MSAHQEPSSPSSDPFLFDTEDLHTLTDPATLGEGLGLFREHAVTDVQVEDLALWARVDDKDFDEPPEPSLGYDADGNLQGSCDCGRRELGLCAHAIAALYAHAASSQADAALSDALEAALEERVTRARNEVSVEPVSGDGWLGTWRARSIGSQSPFPVSYEVDIRSLSRRANFCTCPDFATNQLGTCKHIEAVLHRLRKRPDFDQRRDQPTTRATIWLDWEGDDAPRIRLHRAAETEATLAAELNAWFAADGSFRGRLPEDLLALAERLGDQADLDIGRDAVDFARRLADQAVHAERGREIRAQFQALDGRIPGIQARLYAYQVKGAAFLAGNGRALLADDMGLGKTLQAITAAYWLHRHARVERVLVVCPASLKLQWAREIQRFAGIEAQVVQGPAEARMVQYRNGNGFFVINYELVLRDLPVINQTLAPDLLVLDEAQRIKNWRTKLATAVKQIPSRYAFVLSGTPLENRLEDLYSLMQVVDPHVLGPLWRYMADFHVTDERGKVLGYRNLSALRRRLRPVMLRRDRSLVSDQLPQRITTRVDVAMDDVQRGLHDDAVSEAARIAQIMRRRPLTPTEQNRMMAAMQRARMACNAAGLVDKESEGAPKLDELQTLLGELCGLSGLKAVVFSQWERMTEMVERRCRNMGLGVVRLHGGVPTAKRGALMDRFRDDDAVQVFVSTDAGGVGLNLQSASVLVNLDMPWNPAVLDQRIARVHRLGQKRPVQVVLMIAPDSYEERVTKLVEGKRNLFDNVVDPDAGEDVVGISKRLAEVLAEDLTGTGAADTATTGEGADADAEVQLEEPESDSESAALLTDAEESSSEESAIAPGAATLSGEDLSGEIQAAIADLQAHFGPRIRRMLGASGSLCLVLDRVDDEDDALAAELCPELPVALIDPRTLRSLQRLGSASPLADAPDLMAGSEPEPPASEPPLLRKARERLQAARDLIPAGQSGVAAELLRDALLAAVSHQAGLERPPAASEAGVWAYAEGVPQGWLDADTAALVMRAVALAQGSVTIPEALLIDLAGEVEAVL